jgi:hypothetical protein
METGRKETRGGRKEKRGRKKRDGSFTGEFRILELPVLCVLQY